MPETALIAGWSRTDITPPLGSRLRGYFVERLASGVHDPLHAKALYLAEGDAEVAFVACDLCSGAGVVTEAARAKVAARGMNPEALVIHATHTHLGPYANEHVEALSDAIAEAALAAKAGAGPVAAAAGKGHEDTVAFCRRFLMADGTTRTNPGVGNPDIVRPTAPIDPEVTVLALTAEDGRRLVVVNYALHLDTIGGTEMSADYPHVIEEVVRKSCGDDVDVLFIQGCSGDVNHVDVFKKQPQKGFDMAAHIGRALGAEVVRTLDRLEPVALSPLSVQREVLAFDVPLPSEDEVEAARAIIAQPSTGGLVEERVRAFSTVRRAEKGSPLRVEVSGVRAGEVALAAFPGELFCAFGRRLKEQSSARFTLAAELSHDDLSYVPTPDALAGGAYEVWAARLPAEGGDRIIDTALALVG